MTGKRDQRNEGRMAVSREPAYLSGDADRSGIVEQKEKTMRSVLIILSAVAALTAPLRATTFESGDTQATLLELYTSEGCSSCPPAEARLAALRDDPRLWKMIVPVAFHVDYWDHLGWPDRFASKAFTRRQYDYAALWRSGSVYTPAFVQNGREGTGPTSTSKPGQLRADVNPKGVINVTFLPTTAPTGALVVEAAPLADGVTSDVRRGENAGRKLTHEFVALDLIHATLEKHDGSWTASLPLPPQSVASASALAVWVHPADNPMALQAVGGWLANQSAASKSSGDVPK